MKGWFGQKERHRQAALKGRRYGRGKHKIGKGTTMFYLGEGKYSQIVTFASPIQANSAAAKLMKEFNSAKTRAKKVRVMRVAQLAANRAKASLKRKGLKKDTRLRLVVIEGIYGASAERMQKKL